MSDTLALLANTVALLWLLTTVFLVGMFLFFSLRLSGLRQNPLRGMKHLYACIWRPIEFGPFERYYEWLSVENGHVRVRCRGCGLIVKGVIEQDVEPRATVLR